MALSRRKLMVGAIAAPGLAFTLAACGTSTSSDSGVVLANGTEPENPLVPTNTNEVGGGRVVTSVFAGLVYYDDKGKVHSDVAESIESQDKQTWTIKAKKDQVFSDGSPVTAKSFVDAWNFGALSTNAQKSSSHFDPIEGFEAVAPAEGDPTAKEMSGLKVVDDHTFTVKLVSPQSDFPKRLGYTAYSPMPESAFKDMKAYGEKPVGNGPYVVETWDHQKQIVLVPNEKYNGPRKPKNKGLTFVFYSDPETMYNDLQSGGVDVVDQIPNSQLATFKQDLGDRAVNDPGSLFQSFTVAQNDPNFSGEAGKLRRKALSMAINREEICTKLFHNTRTPATDFVPPTIEGGGSTDIPGREVLTYDKAKAQDLWKQAEAIQPFKAPFTLAYNADGPHKDWVEAVCNSIKNTLGIDAQPKPYPAFGEFRKQITERKMTGGYRTGWQADYPSIYNFLAPLYSTAAADGRGSNDGDYKNPEFDKLIGEGLAATDDKTAMEKFRAAETVLFEDLPAIPLWYQNSLGGYSTAVKDVRFGWDTVPIYQDVAK
ncbi:peptide ABC transporter substrate-binding protein [Devriesea agamarum]|uniref:peptide ABC transporter substrate-binding protein n=1 Tax=Devriesea agamarum TaxID=472569 RepID=UPI000A02C243|nr:ABC transporter substrate-binding protein [Devriesea agamarum]